MKKTLLFLAGVMALAACNKEPLPKSLSISTESGSTSVELGETIQLVATATPSKDAIESITWTSLAPEIATVDANGLVTAINTGTVTIEAEAIPANEKGSPVKGSISITVEIQKPHIVTQPQAQTVALNASYTLSVEALGERLNYQWMKRFGENGDLITVVDHGQSITESSDIAGDIHYYCIVSNEFGSVTSETAVVTVVTTPYIMVQPQNRTIKAGQTIKLSITALGDNLKYDWQTYYEKNWLSLPNASNGKSTMEIPTNSSITLGNYIFRCKVSNDDRSVTSEYATVTITAN
ncbi:MAG: Ig-like domain-containing protein [Bacteroidales bacterium]|nr:Ig-like domain-containing protein [Bacteroidales bacterium]